MLALWDATRGVKEEILYLYLNLSELQPLKNHPVGVRDDSEMQGLVESVKALGSISLRWFSPVRAADMRSSPDIAASVPVNWPGLSICPVLSAT